MNSKMILVALRRITRAIDQHSKQLEKSAGLTVPQLLVMQCLAGESSLTVGEIARRVNLSQGTITSVLERMSTKGLVERSRSAEDRRKVMIRLSANGTRRLENCPDLLQQAFLRQFNELEDWEQHMLIAAMERIAALMDAEDVDASPILQIGEV